MPTHSRKLLAGTGRKRRRADRRRKRREAAAELRVAAIACSAQLHAPPARYRLAQRAGDAARHRIRSSPDQVIVLSAHLDGYGYGEPVKGDRLYNGTLDDAAYVALLIRLRRAASGPAVPPSDPVRRVDRRGEGPARLALVRGASDGSKVADRGRHQPRPAAADLPARAADRACARRHDASATTPGGRAQPRHRRCRTIRSRSATCSGAPTMAVHAGGHSGDGVRLRLSARLAERADLPAMVSHRLSQAAGRSEAADGLEGRGGLQPLLLRAWSSASPTSRAAPAWKPRKRAKPH